jgi:hypothetical protein
VIGLDKDDAHYKVDLDGKSSRGRKKCSWNMEPHDPNSRLHMGKMKEPLAMNTHALGDSMWLHSSDQHVVL